MKRILLAVLLISGIQTINAQGNYIQINGTTNVNSFKCTNASFRNDNFSGSQLPDISLKVNDFDCQNRMMTKDFQKTLESEKYPNLSIKFVKITKSQNGYSAQIQVMMMDKSRTYQIAFSEQKEKWTGKKQVRFSDFDIKPPKKMGGMIVVRDELDLIFSLTAK